MAKIAPVLVVVLFVGACTDEPPAPGKDDPNCQLQAEGEKSPGYPFDLQRFNDQVLPILTGSCAAAGCHGAPQGAANFTVYQNAAPGNCEYLETFTSMRAQIDLTTPTNSPLYTAVSGANPRHPIRLDANSAELAVLLDFASSAAAVWAQDGGGSTAPPGASPFDYRVFQDTIQPIVDTAGEIGCAGNGCHGTGAAGFALNPTPEPASAEMEQNFLAITARTNLQSPAASLFYLKATTSHAAGASPVVSAAQARAILDWIERAQEVGIPGDGVAPSCPPASRFNSGVFRDEILPMLSGDLDLNNRNSVGSLGCTRGPCHGTERGPGTLFLSSSLDLARNLQNFACFVSPANPSASEILVCPLNDPRCSRYPHPGQDVLGGAGDLNFQRLLGFLYSASVDGSPLDFAFFVRRINPIFNDVNAVQGGAQGRTCADATSCHGVSRAGQVPANGSNFAIIPAASSVATLTSNFAAASSFVNFLNPEESSLFLYPTNEIANLKAHASATGLPHPGGADFAVDSAEALAILKWANGLRPDGNGFVRDWLVGGDYPSARITDATPIDEANVQPAIFDPTGALEFNNGQWDGLFADSPQVDLNRAFPRAATAGRAAYAVAYVINTTGSTLAVQLVIDTDNPIRVYTGPTLTAQANRGRVEVPATLPSFARTKQTTRILIKLLQQATDDTFAFALQVQDQLGRPLSNQSGELVIRLSPGGGI
jgi:hypothetical protein